MNDSKSVFVHPVTMKTRHGTRHTPAKMQWLMLSFWH